jgi:putative transposase
VRQFRSAAHFRTEMPRIARVSIAGIPYHITQRGNARQIVFSDAQDYRVYLKLLRRYSDEHKLRIWAWCLMPNHVHLLAIPETSTTLACALGSAHREYARYRNSRSASCGHLWQARFFSCPVEDRGVWPVMAYIERNPVRAGLTPAAESYQWSSARCHTASAATDSWLRTAYWCNEVNAANWRDVLRIGLDEASFRDRLRDATDTGRPFGSEEFAEGLERRANRTLRRRPPGRSSTKSGTPYTATAIKMVTAYTASAL